ncbi:coiled-coil domain-containing protein 112-like, partial [Homalodisca vitripennis]|uniref:coiled-coil domain-containing protein 112-like n=1 Tax=Homalodisca vitripennis TaxID=197043 RepID=UPI001EEC0801
MGNYHKLPDVQEVEEQEEEENSTICSAKSTRHQRKDHDKIPLQYTNRRRVERVSADSSKSNEERKKENEQEFENIRSQIEDYSISKGHSSQRSNNRKSCSASNSASSSGSSHPEVEAFQKYLNEHGGHYGGWKVKDHLFFLKMKKKYPLNKTAETVNEHFPDISIEMVLAHDVWYNEYSRLRIANKRAVEEWKKSQQSFSKVEEKPKPEPISQTVPIKRDPRLKEKIEIWKAHTLAAKLKRMEEHQEKELRKKREEEEKKKLQEQKRALVDRYRQEKLSEEMAMKTAEETERLQAKQESMQQAATLLKYFRYEDRRFTDRL